MQSDERELLAEELQREVAAALASLDPLSIVGEMAEMIAGSLIDEFRKRRIVLYRRAEHRLPAGLIQTKVEDYIEGESG